MRHRSKQIDISTEEKRREVYDKLDSFTSKSQVYEYFGINDNASGIAYMKNIAESVGFDMNVYKERRKKPIHYCIQCGKKIDGFGTKFCSLSCAAVYNNMHRDKSIYDKLSDTLRNKYPENSQAIRDNNGRSLKKYTNICINCGKEFIGRTHNQKYCPECRSKRFPANNDIKKKIHLERFYNNDYSDSRPSMVSTRSVIKTHLLEKYQYKCQLCGFEGYNKKTGYSILQIHHIDGNCRNNTPENIQLLCPNCHAMTENYMALNKGNSTRH